MDEPACSQAVALLLGAADRADRRAVAVALVEVRRHAGPVELAVVLTTALGSLHGGELPVDRVRVLALEAHRKVVVWAPELSDPALFEVALSVSAGGFGAAHQVEFPRLVFSLLGVLWCWSAGWSHDQRAALVAASAVASRPARAGFDGS